MFSRIIGLDPESNWLGASVMKGNCNGDDCADRGDYCGNRRRPCGVFCASRDVPLFKVGSLIAAISFIGALLSLLAEPFFSEEGSLLVISALRNILTNLRLALGLKRLECLFFV